MNKNDIFVKRMKNHLKEMDYHLEEHHGKAVYKISRKIIDEIDKEEK